jgi:hypothetical protein
MSVHPKYQGRFLGFQDCPENIIVDGSGYLDIIG